MRWRYSTGYEEAGGVDVEAAPEEREALRRWVAVARSGLCRRAALIMAKIES